MTPFVEVSLGGSVLAGFAPRALSGQIVEYDGDHADELHLAVSNHDGRLKKPRADETISVAAGWRETGVVKFGQFVVTEVTKVGPRAEFHITGHAADLKKKLKEQKSRAWAKDKTLGDVIRDVAKDNGLTAAIDQELAKIQIEKIIAQAGESDMHLVTRLARQYGALAKPKDGRLIFVKKGAGRTASGGEAGRAIITPNDCVGFTFSSNARNERGKAKAAHYDRSKAKRTTEQSTGGAASDGAPDYFAPNIFGTQVEAVKTAQGRKAQFDRDTGAAHLTLAPGQVGVAPGGVIVTQGFGDDDDREWTAAKRFVGWDAKGLVVRLEGKPMGQEGESGGGGGGGA